MPVSYHARIRWKVRLDPFIRRYQCQHARAQSQLCAISVVTLLSFAQVYGALAATELTPVRGSISTLGGKRIAGKDGVQYLLPGGIRVNISAQTEATLQSQPQFLSLDAGKRTPTYSVFLKSGTVNVDIPASAVGAVAVVAPADVRVICREGMSAISASNQTALVWTERFPILLSQKERLSKLPPGIIRKFSRDTTENHKALEAPSWLTGRHLWLAVPEPVKVSNFAWSPVAEAETYRVELREVATGTLVVEFTQAETQVKDELPRLPPGDYQLYVRAIDRDAMPGTLSQAMPLKIVGIDLPNGAKFQPDSRIEMSGSQTVQLKNADGLSLRRARERTSRPATEPVGIVNGQPTPLMIQDGDSTDACLMWLLPNQSPVAALVGPKWVVWPHEDVNLLVQWSDKNGRRLPEGVEPTVSVFVGIKRVEVVWDKQPDAWRARLEAQPGAGPWVVRLEVRDQVGSLLARDFVEVASRTRQRFSKPSDNLAELTDKH